MQITGKTKIVCLIGYPVGHSLSPKMHNACFLHLNMDWAYLPFPVKPENLEGAIRGLGCLGVVGCNVTIPHKIEAMKYLTEIDKKALKIGAVNTLLFNKGKIQGFNTDGDGFIASLKEIGFEPQGKNVLLLGAGGAGRAIGISLASCGIKKLAIFDLNEERGNSLGHSIEKDIEAVSLKKIENLDGIDLLINATPCGMKENDPLPCDPSLIQEGQIVYDVIYKKTPLLIEAEKRGARIMNGMEMLIHQGALSFKLWTGVYPPIDVMRKAILE